MRVLDEALVQNHDCEVQTPVMTRTLTAGRKDSEGVQAIAFDRRAVFQKMCLARYFEHKVADAFERKLIPGTIYLAIGQESTPATVSELTGGFPVFNQHRCHAIYLSHGGDPAMLRDELLGLSTGSCGGRGGCPSIYDASIPTFPYHGFIGEHIPLATGYALATHRPTVVYFGDAGSEEDYALTAFGFAATHRLPLLFVCEDNDLSILTRKGVRRSWDILEVVRAMGLPGAAIQDDPEEIFFTVRHLLSKLPAFVTIKSCRHYWHAGVGIDGPPQWDRVAEMRETVADAEEIERGARDYVERLWRSHLD